MISLAALYIAFLKAEIRLRQLYLAEAVGGNSSLYMKPTGVEPLYLNDLLGDEKIRISRHKL